MGCIISSCQRRFEEDNKKKQQKKQLCFTTHSFRRINIQSINIYKKP